MGFASSYDVLITTSRLPRLQKLPKAAYDIPSWEVMKVIFTLLTMILMRVV